MTVRIGSQVDHNPDLYAFRRTYPEGLNVEPDASWFKLVALVAFVAGLFILFGVLLGLPLS